MTTLLSLGIIVTVFSQVDAFADVVRPMMYLFWAGFTLYMFLDVRKKGTLSRFSVYFGIVYVLFVAYCLGLTLFGYDHIQSHYLRVMPIALLMSILGNLCAPFFSLENLRKLCYVYITMALLFGVWVYFNFFGSYAEWLRSTIYLFDQKNSAAQIWSSAMLLLLFIPKYHNKIYRFGGILIFLGFVYLLGMSQCRTAILALLIVLVVWLYTQNKKYAIISALGISLIAVLLWRWEVTRIFVEQSLLLNKYAGTDLNTFSSGRLVLYAEAWKTFLQHPFAGVGLYYVDNSYLSVLAESGVVGFVMIESIWVYKIMNNIKLAKQSRFSNLLYAWTCFYLVESILEGLPPFGPGVSSFMFWFVTAVLYTNRQIRRNN